MYHHASVAYLMPCLVTSSMHGMPELLGKQVAGLTCNPAIHKPDMSACMAVCQPAQPTGFAICLKWYTSGQRKQQLAEL